MELIKHILLKAISDREFNICYVELWMEECETRNSEINKLQQEITLIRKHIESLVEPKTNQDIEFNYSC